MVDYIVSTFKIDRIVVFFLYEPDILFYLFIYVYFWLRWVFVAARGLFSNCGERGLLFVVVLGLLIGWLLLLWSTGSRHAGFSSCGTRAQ